MDCIFQHQPHLPPTKTMCQDQTSCPFKAKVFPGPVLILIFGKWLLQPAVKAKKTKRAFFKTDVAPLYVTHTLYANFRHVRR